MIGINLSTDIGDAVQVTATNAAIATIAMTPAKSVCLQIVAATGNNFWVRQAATIGALPTRAAVIATTPDFTAVAGNIGLLDIARVLDPVVGIYTDAASVPITAFLYHSPSMILETGSVLVKSVMDKLKRVA